MEGTRTPSVDPSQWARLDASDRRQLIRGLRTLGYSYGEIAGAASIPRSTVAMWCNDIVLTRSQQRRIEERTGPEARRGRSVDTQWRRRAEIRRIRDEAARYAIDLADDPLFVAGVCLYWAEGSKTKNDLSITNSDPRVLRVFIEFVRAHLDPLASFSLALNLHTSVGEESAKRYWASALDLHGTRFTKSYIKKPGTGHRKKRLPHGVCRVRVDRGSNHWHRVMTWIEVIGGALGD